MADTTSHHKAEVQHGEGHKEGLPQLNPDSFASQLFWLVVVFTALYLLMARSVLPRIREVLGKRQSQIQHDLDTAEKAKQEAISARASYEAELAATRQQSVDLIMRTQHEIEEHLAKEQAQLQDKLDVILTESSARIEAQREAALEEIQPLVQELTGKIAAQFLPKAPTKTQINKAMKAAGTESS